MAELDPIRVSYVQGFSKLSLWYARKRILEGMSDFQDAINVRVNLYRNTTLYDGKIHPSNEDVGNEWGEILGRLKTVFDKRIDEDDSALLEEEGLAVLWPYMESRCKKRDRLTIDLHKRPYESWSHDYKRGDRLSIHIGNVYKPESPLVEKKNWFAAALIRMLKDSQVRRPEITVVQCGSWLNSMPPFQSLFPEAWMEDTRAGREVRYTMGHWGQFENRQGDFHAPNGVRFRETGEFPYTSLSCYCDIEDILNHLEAAFIEAVAHNEAMNYVPSA